MFFGQEIDETNFGIGENAVMSAKLLDKKYCVQYTP